MANKEKKRSIFARIRNYFIAGMFVLIPIGINSKLFLESFQNYIQKVLILFRFELTLSKKVFWC